MHNFLIAAASASFFIAPLAAQSASVQGAASVAGINAANAITIGN